MRHAIRIPALLVGLALATAASAADMWVHVRVEERGGERVHVNVPIDMVGQILPHIRADRLRDGKIVLEDHDLRGTDLKEMWTALRAAKDGDYVTVRGGDGNVRVSKRDGMMRIDVDDPSEGGQQVRVRIPLRLVDALLAPGENTLDVAAAMRVLSESGAGDLVTVTGGDESVRIWVDDVASPDEGASR